MAIIFEIFRKYRLLFLLYLFLFAALSIHSAYIIFDYLSGNDGYDNLIYKILGLSRRDQINISASCLVASTIALLLYICHQKLSVVSNLSATFIVFNLIAINSMVATIPGISTEFRPEFWGLVALHLLFVFVLLNIALIFIRKVVSSNFMFLLFSSSLSLITVTLTYVFLLDSFARLLTFMQVSIVLLIFTLFFISYYLAATYRKFLIVSSVFLAVSAVSPGILYLMPAESRDVPSTTNEFSGFDFSERPDIYLVSVETLLPPTLARKHLGLDDLPYAHHYSDGGYIFKNSFSTENSTQKSLNATMRLSNPAYAQDYSVFEKYTPEKYFLGFQESPISTIFRENGYQVWTGITGNLDGATLGPYVDRPALSKDVSIADTHFCLIGSKAAYALFFMCPMFEFLEGRSSSVIEDETKKIESLFTSVGQSDPPQFKFYHALGMTRHAATFSVFNETLNAEYAQKYQEGAVKAREYIENIIDKISKNGRKSIVLVFGDHGMRRMTESEKDDHLKVYVEDNYGIHFMIGLNTSNCSTQNFQTYSGDGFTTPSRVIAGILRCLVKDKQRFDTKVGFLEDFDFSNFLYE